MCYPYDLRNWNTPIPHRGGSHVVKPLIVDVVCTTVTVVAHTGKIIEKL